MNIDDLRSPPLPPWYKDVWYFYDWMAVLCSPPLLREMRRAPIPEHLIRLLDAYLPFAKTSERWLHRPPDFKVDQQKRLSLALKLREIFQRWTPPDIPDELVETARALMRTEGVEWPPRQRERRLGGPCAAGGVPDVARRDPPDPPG